MCLAFVPREALATPEGRAVFENGEQKNWPTKPEDEYIPKLCKIQNCTVKVLHIAAKGYDEGVIEALVENLRIPAHIAYIGQENHTQAIWNGYTEGAPGLFYTYWPNSNQHGIPIPDLGRAKIPPGIDIKSQRIAVLCCVTFETKI